VRCVESMTTCVHTGRCCLSVCGCQVDDVSFACMRVIVVYMCMHGIEWGKICGWGGPQHDCSMNAMMCQKETPDSAAGCVIDRHDHYKGVIMILDRQKGNCVL
jgi:hypothetical protein